MSRFTQVFVLILMCSATAAMAPSAGVTVLRFSTTAPGETLPIGWKPYAMSRHHPEARMAIVSTDIGDVLNIRADAAAGAVAHQLTLPASTTLSWRWKVDHSVAAADLSKKSGDDFAARVYVFFDVPRSRLSLWNRIKLSVARHTVGHPVPTAALCYVWDNRHALDSITPSVYFSGIRTIVLQSGNAKAGKWQLEHRDLAADFRAAFGRAAPRVTGIALASDTDNTKSRAQAWFGDLTLTPDRTPSAGKDTSP